MIKSIIVNDVMINDIDELTISNNSLIVTKKVRDENYKVKLNSDGNEILNRTWISLNDNTVDIMCIACDGENIINRVIG